MKYLSPDYWMRLLRDPIVASGLAVDLAPVFMVLVAGWGAAELVLLYWLENVIIGVFALGRILLSGFGTGR